MELALTDEGLLDGLRTGEERAFEELVRRHHRALLAVARSIVGESEAEEVVQIAWIKAHRALPAFEGRSSLRTWLSRIVMNEGRMQLRSRKREVFIDDAFAGDGDALTDRFQPSGAWSSPPHQWQEDSPEALLTAEHLQDCLQRLMREMPDNQRVLLEMRDAGGIDFDQICNALEISASNARVLLHRCTGSVISTGGPLSGDRRMLKCREVPAEAELLLAGDLGWRRRMALRMHLLLCVHCRRYVRQLRLLLSSVPFMHGPASDEEVKKVISRVRCDSEDHQH